MPFLDGMRRHIIVFKPHICHKKGFHLSHTVSKLPLSHTTQQDNYSWRNVKVCQIVPPDIHNNDENKMHRSNLDKI